MEFKKKFREDDNYTKFNDQLKKMKVDYIKLYKFGSNNDEEIIETINYYKNKNKNSIHNNILDFRFFDVQINNDISFCIIHHSNPNDIIMKLLNNLNCKIFNESKVGDNEEEFLIHLENQLKILIIEFDEINRKLNLTKKRIILYFDFENSIIIFNILNFLTKIKKQNLNFDLIIVTDESIICNLNSGMNTIFISNNLFTKKGVGLLPTENSVISTQGLKWDVSHWTTNFGVENLSTSNELIEDECNIYVESGNMIFTAQIDINKIKFE